MACPTWSEPTRVGQVQADGLDELSGLAMHSAQGPMWVHNDSGASPLLHALGTDGSLLGSIEVTGGSNVDWEDISAAPNGGLWLADIGDNDAKRPTVTLMHIATPPGVTDSSVPSIPHTLTYQGGARDAEAVLVDIDGQVYVVDKQNDGRSSLFRADLESGELVFEASISIDGPGALARSITAGDIGQNGELIVLRTYFSAFVWRRESGASLADAFSTAPCPVDIPIERQGEAIAFEPQGASLITVSEGTDQPVWRIDAN